MIDKNTINCGKHGNCNATFICNHLVNGKNLGFNCGYDEDNTDETHPDAWCDECDQIFEKEGWTDKAAKFADIKVLCASCYEEIRLRNWYDNEDKFDELIRESYSYMEDKQKDLMEKYKIGSYERWDWDQETGLLVFSHDGITRVEAKICFSGSLSTISNTWLWSWGNTSTKESMKSEARKVRDLGDDLNIMKLSCAKWKADEIDGWEMTIIMAKELKSIGVYRTPNEKGFSYMVISDAWWVNENGKRMK